MMEESREYNSINLALKIQLTSELSLRMATYIVGPVFLLIVLMDEIKISWRKMIECLKDWYFS